ncbi:hypothetical protein [Streptomyces acidiscabies]|uniref:N-acetylmuramoyl-L-alanine amidase n=1 Tax=Streptomyces acidiscabies TaxID=42234 RepID=A0AAP6BCV0_9ACTN|nr:hypothetical protein [Streptomyces acidiscabies]MBZ3909431.1 hypothetical protein [Streptomyces acidiscabies]MDX2962401.1 hypothetical protein [Streptomyces acidiscabies]MDX3792420.1 hypothetical protein [Streptomyces acidiscabies]
MSKTGPQLYPGASQQYRYQGKYGGSPMEVNVVVLHTTEGRTLPDYGGGASAPTLTAVPDTAAKKLRWYQHFDIDVSARALVNLKGGVETNTNNVAQIELVGTCDPATRAEWVKAGKRQNADFIFWPEAPDWALAELAAFLRWMNRQHGVPLSGPSSWPAYPGSYGATRARMTGEQWNGFRGVCGHMHVPENTHGDPGSINFPRLIALAKGTNPTSEEDTDMPTAKEIATAVWAQPIPNRFRKDAAGKPVPTPAGTFLEYGDSHFDVLVAKVDSLTTAVEKLTAALAAKGA